MTAAPIPFAARQPAYAGPREFLSAMAGIGATAVLRRSDDGVALDFAVPTARAHRARVLIGDRSAWTAERWEVVTALAVVMSSGGLAMLDAANDEACTVDLAALAPRRAEPAAVVPFRPADTRTPAALVRALTAIHGTLVLRRDADGLGIGFEVPGQWEQRLDLLLVGCAGWDGDWWLAFVGEVARRSHGTWSPWTMRVGEVRRVRLDARETDRRPATGGKA